MIGLEQIKRRPGRPRKVDLTPLEAALAEPLPATVGPALANVEAARKALSAANAALSEARGDAIMTANREAVQRAESALQRAIARRAVAERLGDDDAPTAEDIDALEQEYGAAKRKLDVLTPRIEAFRAEFSRRREMLASAVKELREAMQPYEADLTAAGNTQVEEAAKLYGQVLALSALQRALGNVRDPVLLRNAAGENIKAAATIAAPPELRDIYSVLYQAAHEANRGT